MKTLAVLLALTSVTHAADPLKSLLGTWTGKHRETRSWVVEAYDTRLTGTRRPDGGVLLTERTASGHVYKYTFAKNGRFTEHGILRNIITIDSYAGTWKAAGGKISVTAKGTDGRFSGTFDPSSSKLIFRGHAGAVELSINSRR